MFQRETSNSRRKFHPPAPVRHPPLAGGGRDRSRRTREAVRRLAAVRGLTFSVEPGEVLGLVGPNGAGKTTTHPQHRRDHHSRRAGGSASAGTTWPTDPVAAKPSLAFIPDEPHLFDYLTVEEHLRFVGRLYQVADVDARHPRPARGARAGATSATALPGELSRGMKQKLAIACGLLHGPQALLLDEPLTGLDPVGIRRMKATIVRRAAAGAAVILSSHLLHLVEEICTRILVMNARTGRGPRHRGRDHREPAGVERPSPGGRLPGAHHSRGRSAGSDPGLHLPGVALHVQPRRAAAPPAPEPALSGRAGAWALATSGSCPWSSGPTGHRRSWSVPAWLELMGAIGVVGALLWGWVFGVERRVLAFSPAEVTFLFSGPVTRRGLVQYKLLRNQVLILFNSLLWTLILARERFGASPWLRAMSIWVLLTTISFHRLGASFVRTSLLEHGRIALRHRLVSLALLGVLLVGLVWSVQDALPDLAAGWAGGLTTFLDALADASTRPVPRVLLAPFRAMVRPLAAHTARRLGYARSAPRSGCWCFIMSGSSGRTPPSRKRPPKRPAARAARGLPRARRCRPSPTASRLPCSASRPSAGRRGAILWKNLLAVVRTRRARNIAMAILVAAVLAGLSSFQVVGSVAEVVGWLAATWAGLAIVIGPQWIRNDLRSDLLKLDMLRSYPLAGRAVVAAETAASAVVLTALQIGLLLVAYFAFLGNVGMEPDLATRTVALVDRPRLPPGHQLPRPPDPERRGPALPHLGPPRQRPARRRRGAGAEHAHDRRSTPPCWAWRWPSRQGLRWHCSPSRGAESAGGRSCRVSWCCSAASRSRWRRCCAGWDACSRRPIRRAPRSRPEGAYYSTTARSNRPNRSASGGSTNRLSAVDVSSPPRITIAIGPSISRPGSPLPSASGRSPSAVTSAVIRIGPSRSSAPRIAVSRPQGAPSTATRCS